MRVKCVICDKIESIEDENPLAKKLRNRPIHTYMCQDCHDRIEAKTLDRQATGKLTFYKGEQKTDNW